MRPLYYVLLMALLATGCRKKDQPSSTETTTICFEGNYQIAYEGKLFINEPIQFSNNIPECKSIMWMFGDGTSSIERNPKHIFTQAGNYNIIIIVDGDSSNKKQLNITAFFHINNPYNPAIVAQMANSRNWDVTLDSVNRTTLARTKYKTYTETFAIQVLNDSTLVFKTDTVVAYNRNLGVYDAYIFGALNPKEFEYKNLYYYFAQDSIVCNIHPDQGGMPAAGKHGATLYGITTTYVSHK